MSKNVTFAELYTASKIPPNGGLPAQNQTNAIIIPPPPPAKSLQEALDRGLSTYEYTSRCGLTYTIDVERALRARRKIQIEQSKHTPRMLLEPDQRAQHDREHPIPPPPTPEELQLRKREAEERREYFKWKREWEQEKARLEEGLRTGRYGDYPDSHWRLHDLEPPKKEEPKKEQEEEDEIDLGYSDTSDDSEETITIVVE